MEAVCVMTKEKNIPTRVSLHPLILAATGMCGSCRVNVAGKDVLACVQGPEFDGDKVDFAGLKIRMNAFAVKEGSEGKELQCYSQPSQFNRPRNESGIFQKFLSGFQKSRP